MTMKKLVYMLLIFAFFAFLIMQKQTQPVSYELMYKVDSIAEAKEFAMTYNIEFVEYSDYGYAIYEASNMKEIETYLEFGFEFNGSYQIANNPIFGHNDSDLYYNDQYSIPMMDVDDAWALETGDPSYLIAIVDTGIDTNHVEFTHRISVDSYNAVTKTVGLAAVEDLNGYGTNVAGVIGANNDMW